MTSSESVQPLCINKTPSPPKISTAVRVLSEISPGEKRRNSPSWNQSSKMTLNPDSSPFQPSPIEKTASPHVFWQGRNFVTENTINYASIRSSPLSMRRSSLERLQKASRVKNSEILALEHKQEYDPTRTYHIERPLAKVQGNAFGGSGIRANFELANNLRTPERRPNNKHQRSHSTVSGPAARGHVRGAASTSALAATAKSSPAPPQKTTRNPVVDPVLSSPPAAVLTPETRSPLPSITHTPSREQTSPIKSSLSSSRFKSSFNEETGQWTLEDTGHPRRTLHRHAKSVTFDNAPPQVNEYEMTTPDLSVVETDSQEGSYTSDDDYDEYDPEYRHDDPEDSFDASLEDTDKTPVVLPDADGWHRDDRSPPTPRRDGYDYSPAQSFAAAAAAGRQLQQRTESVQLDHRPLPPLPGRELNKTPSPTSLDSAISPSALSPGEQIASAQRGLPSPPAHRTSDAHTSNIGHSKMPLEERLKLMMLSDDGKTAAEQQRERRLRRAGGRDKIETPEQEALRSAPESPNVNVDAAAIASAMLSATTSSPLSITSDAERQPSPDPVDTLAPPPPPLRSSRSSYGSTRESLTPTPDSLPPPQTPAHRFSLVPAADPSMTERSSSPVGENEHDESDYTESRYNESRAESRSESRTDSIPESRTESRVESHLDDHPDTRQESHDELEDDHQPFSYEQSYDSESGSDENVDISVLSDYDLPPLTRESIMRGVDKAKVRKRESDYNFSSPPPSSSPLRPTTSHSIASTMPGMSPRDADVPLPTTEESSMMYDDEEEGGSVIIRRDLAELVTDDEDTEGENSVVIHRNGVYDMYTDDEFTETEDGDFMPECDTTSQFSSNVDSEKSLAAREASATLTPTQTTIDVSQSPPKLVLNAPLLPRPGMRHDSGQKLQLTEQTQLLPPQQAEAAPQRPRTPPRTLSKPEYDGTGWGEPSVYETSNFTNQDEEDRTNSPDSVIHHPVEGEEDSMFDDGDFTEQEDHDRSMSDDDRTPEAPLLDAPAIPERQATIKSTTSGLKTRPSATPADITAMREQRRIVSREIAVPDVPSIPDATRERINKMLDVEQDLAGPDSNGTSDYMERHPSFKKRSLTLDLDMGLSLDKDFDRVIQNQKVTFEALYQERILGYSQPAVFSETDQIMPLYRLVSTNRRNLSRRQSRKRSSETKWRPTSASSVRRCEPSLHVNSMNAEGLVSSFNSAQTTIPHAYTYANLIPRQKRGYLMRQNTKLVTASDKDNHDPETWKARSAGNSPVKTENRPQSWGVVEPWNGNKRQRSLRSRAMITSANGAVPPMPGQESNAQTALNPLAEEDAELATEEAGERGRLFVKVMGVKDLDLPIPKNERTWFSLTLDNGVHCVTTAWLELARNAPIGQEFELVVPNDLEFQLTLNVKLDKPVQRAAPSIAPARMTKTKTSTFSRVFASPKKRKEMEQRLREEEERVMREQQEAQAKQQRSAAPTAWDLLSPLAADDGSFARSYVCLKDHEARCFGRPYLTEVACFNEWAKEDANFACSVKSKRGNTGVVRRAPYRIGKLELQLLFVPRPKGCTDEEMPKSMNSCIREMKAAEERLATCFEGHLSQQGGDCPYWRRRYFKLVGTKLTAYHEATRQPRATINLANAKRLIGDRRALTEKEFTGKNGHRRRSAFAEDEEGYMFVEEGFRIRFNNGEVIDFYADTAQDKEAWMRALVEVVGRSDSGNDNDGNAPKRSKWCEIVFKREEALRRRAAEARQMHARNKSAM